MAPAKMAQGQRVLLQTSAASRGPQARRSPAVRVRAEAEVATVSKMALTPAALEASSTAVTLQGSARSENQDRYETKYAAVPRGMPFASLGVFDGHGGGATAQWLAERLFDYVGAEWGTKSNARALTAAFVAADMKLLEQPKGLFGMLGERGVGGTKCGSTAATAFLAATKEGGTMLTTANVGDARTLLVKNSGEVLQLSNDHVPDSENERRRIEAQNPNPKMPLVKYVGGTWRVGGLLALSRAFGDSYMKATGEFEGISYGNSDYESGFGVIAEPEVFEQELEADDQWLLIFSDGLNSNEERGGGGGLSNEDIAASLPAAGSGADLQAVALALARAAQGAGSTDDITVLITDLAAASKAAA